MDKINFKNKMTMDRMSGVGASDVFGGLAP